MSTAKTYYIAELVGAVEGPALLGVATLLANALVFPLERIGQMPVGDGNTGVLVLWETASSEADPSRIWSVPPEDVSRQATAALRGYVYQLHASAAAWLALGPDDEIYLEVAEDYTELLRKPGAVDDVLRATQVKDTRESGAVTLNSPDVLAAIEALHRLRVCNPGREAKLVFLTTSCIGQERKDALPSGVAGLTAWEAAASGGDVEELRVALLQRMLSEGLRAFVANSPPEQLRAELLRSVVFACGMQDWRALEEGNRRALMALRNEFQATADMAYRAYDAVFCEAVACALGPAPRRLNTAQLRACLERATSIAVPSSVAVNLLGSVRKVRTVRISAMTGWRPAWPSVTNSRMQLGN